MSGFDYAFTCGSCGSHTSRLGIDCSVCGWASYVRSERDFQQHAIEGNAMKIAQLTTENVQRVKAVTIKPDGGLVIVGGKNESGKTSTISSIAMAIGGKKLCPDVPIRRGQKTGKAEVTLDNGMVATRNFTPGGSTLTVVAADGRKFTSPQGVLDELLGELGFDPLEFIRMKADKQGEMLRQLVGIDTTELDERRKKIYDQRTTANRDVTKMQVKLETMIPEKDDLPEEEVSVSKLLTELEGLREANARFDEKNKALVEVRDRYRGLSAEIEELERSLEQRRAVLATWAEKGKLVRAEFSELVLQDVGNVEQRIRGAESLNARIRTEKTYQILSDEALVLQGESNRLTSEIEAIDQAKEKTLAGATYPVPGLRVDVNGQVLLDDLPLSQASMAQKLKTSVAMGLSLNPELRVMCIYDGSLLDEDSLAVLAEMADAADAQVWIERVSQGSECTVIIEDGEVKSDG